MTKTVISTGRNALLLAGLCAGSLAWSAECQENADAAKLDTASAADEIQVELPAGWYEFFHNAALHRPDGLGDYVQNYQVAYPN